MGGDAAKAAYSAHLFGAGTLPKYQLEWPQTPPGESGLVALVVFAAGVFRPELVGPGGQQFGLCVSRMHTLVAALTRLASLSRIRYMVRIEQ
jgi:hypothetical protein